MEVDICARKEQATELVKHYHDESTFHSDYGVTTLAKDVKMFDLFLGENLKKTGCMHEYYNPFTGEPIMNGGFINWNIPALNMVSELEEVNNSL